jgi:hypothetical protein
MAQTSGISAKEMGDTRYYAAYAKLPNGSYCYSTAHSYSPRQYAMNMLGRESTSQKQKALCVAMLNYGAEAQRYFGYRTEDLMNGALSADQQALVREFDASLFAGAIAAEEGKTVNFTRTEGFSGRTATVSFDGAFAINYYFTPNAQVSGGMTLYIWTPEAYAGAEVLTTDNAAAVTMRAEENGSYWAQIDGIAAKYLDETYYVAGVYTDAAGNTCCTGVISYSLSRYCLNKTEGSMAKLSMATAMYGYYAARYFEVAR